MASKLIVKKHLAAAKADIARGTSAFRSAAAHIAAAVEAGATQAEVAAKVGKSQPWVSRLLKWRDGGFESSGPFDHPAPEKYYPGNNLKVKVEHAAPQSRLVKIEAVNRSTNGSGAPLRERMTFTPQMIEEAKAEAAAPQGRRERVERTMRFLLASFDGDVEAMAAVVLAVLDQIRVEQPTAATEAVERGVLH
jgi:hypothetical protein